ncbi:outer membrane lipoprotein carrier protein LolA [bacterium]|nr:outer membrane lipoprotein carrier protein LolA [bacterium]
MTRYLRAGLKPVGWGLFLLLWLYPAGAFKTARAETDLLQQIRSKAQSIQSLQAEFVQKKQMRILVQPLISKGRFFFRAPASIRWEYQSPVSSIILMHQGDVKRFFKKDGKTIRDTGANLQAMQVVMQNIVGWLGGRFDENPDFKMTLQKNRILLTPSVSMSGMLARIELLLSDRQGMIDRIVIYEDDENYTEIEFKTMQINRVIPDSVFLEIS